MPVTSDGEWNTVTFADATQADFSGRDFAGATPLNFGFGLITNEDVAGGVSAYQGLALAVLLLGLWRYRQRQRGSWDPKGLARRQAR